MRITLVGSRHFGVATLQMLRGHDVDVVRVVVADADDRLAAAAREAGIAVVVQANPKLVVASEIAGGTDLIVTAHSHARVAKEALAASRLDGVAFRRWKDGLAREMAAITRHARTTTCRATTDGLALILEADVFWELLEDQPAFASGMIHLLAERLDAAVATLRRQAAAAGPAR